MSKLLSRARRRWDDNAVDTTYWAMIIIALAGFLYFMITSSR